MIKKSVKLKIFLTAFVLIKIKFLWTIACLCVCVCVCVQIIAYTQKNYIQRNV